MRLSHWYQSSRPFSGDEYGAVLIYVAIILPVLIGSALLAVDASRLYNLHTHLQKAADALALAGAAELDRRPGARARASNAISTIVSNEQKFATGGVAITVSTIRYLQSLPAGDASNIDASHDAEPGEPGDGATRYVEVVVAPRVLNTILPATFVGAASNTVTTTARAVAGFTSVVCRSMPMFICNPFEGTGTSIFSPSVRGKQIAMQLGSGGTSQYFPGNFGWLDSPAFGTGANALRNALAQVNPPGCYEQNGVTLQTGNIESANFAINVRFDLWDGPYNSARNDPQYRPARNVRKGFRPQPNACSPDPAGGELYRLGRDATWSGRLGAGDWDFDAYWSANYSDLGISPPNGWSNASNRPSRYEVYLHELSTISGGGINLVSHQSLFPESGAPACYSGGGLSDNPDRRLLYAAIINCVGLDVRGSSSAPLEVLAFGRFFMTEPIPRSPDPYAGYILTEFVDVIQPGTVNNDVARDQVQLYR